MDERYVLALLTEEMVECFGIAVSSISAELDVMVGLFSEDV